MRTAWPIWTGWPSGWRRAAAPLVCLMAANNETGVIQPVAEAAALVRAADGWLHVDAVQAAGKIAIDFTALGADTMALSAHKLGGPQGVGALIAGPRAALTRRLHGGGQERGLRAGTENVTGVAGFGAAADAALADAGLIAAQAARRDELAGGEGAPARGCSAKARPGWRRRCASPRLGSPRNCR